MCSRPCMPSGLVRCSRRGSGAREQGPTRCQTFGNVEPSAQGKSVRLLVNPFGEVDGLLLDNDTIVTFPAHMGDELASVVKPGDAVVVKGYPESPSQIKAMSSRAQPAIRPS